MKCNVISPSLFYFVIATAVATITHMSKSTKVREREREMKIYDDIVNPFSCNAFFFSLSTYSLLSTHVSFFEIFKMHKKKNFLKMTAKRILSFHILHINNRTVLKTAFITCIPTNLVLSKSKQWYSLWNNL